MHAEMGERGYCSFERIYSTAASAQRPSTVIDRRINVPPQSG
jgi:hypothetical protein